MSDKTMELSWQDILKVASGKDGSGLPRSAATLAIDKIINERESETIKDCFLEGAEITIHASGGAVIVTADFSYNQLAVYRKCKRICEEWLKDIDSESLTDQQLTLCVVPFILEGQIILYYNQLMFVDGYSLGKNVSRLIMGFDNNVTAAMETEDINYNQVQALISEELRYYEQQIDEDISEAIEEERKAKEQENIIDLEMQRRLNNPIDILPEREVETTLPDSMRFSEEKENVRFVEEEDS